MKLAQTNNKFKSNIDNVESQNFGIGDASVVIDILRNRLYKNKIQTSVQEYICNGRDAMREVGSKRNLEIFAPTKLSPTFRVRDYGPGISPDRMSTVFVNYGASTKRSNNKQTGGFGIGAKSAWSYTDSFTIITYIDGTKRTYVAHTGKRNSGSLDLISTESTKQLNGTEIQIAINTLDIDKFHSAINRCVFFWSTGYAVRGMDLSHHCKGEMFNKYLELNLKGSFLRSISDYYNNDIVCTIDDIPYKLNSFLDKIESLKKIKEIVKGTFIIHMPNGLVEVSANREEISDSDHTIKHLTRLLDQTYNELNTSIQDNFKGITNPYDYVKAFDNYNGKFSLEAYRTFKDYTITKKGTIESPLFKQVKFFKAHVNKKGKLVKNCVNTDTRNRPETFEISLLQKDRLFFNITESAVKVGQRLRKFLENNDNAVLIENSGDNKALQQLIKDLGFKDILKITLPAKSKTTKVKRTSKQICIHRYTGYRKETFHTTIDDNKNKWYYIEMEGNGLPIGYYSSNIKTIERFFDINVCSLSKSSVTLVKKDKNFIELNGFLNKYKPKKDEINSFILKNCKYTHYFNKIKDLKGVNDKDFAFFIDLYKNIHKGDKKMIEKLLPKGVIDKIKNHPDVLSFMKKDQKVKDFIKKYPLIDSLISFEIDKNKDDVVLYMNAKVKGGK